MKINTHIVAALVALGFASQALALDPVVYLTGSTAFRSTIFKVLSDNTGSTNSIWAAGSLTYGTWGNSSAGSANYMLFHGTNKANGHAIYLDCAWSGSEAGIASACGATLTNVLRDGVSTNLNGSPETWVDYTTATGLTATGNGAPSSSPVANGGNLGVNGAQLEASSHIADLAQADTSQAISFTPSTSVLATQLKPYGAEGVVTFVISKNVQPSPSQDWNDTTNVTLPALNTLFANGSCQAWFLNGQPNDLMYCYLVGRNFGSGTRMNMLGDSQYGAHHSVIQNSIGYGVDPRDPSQSPTTLILKNEGNNGYESGGGVAKALADSGGSNASGSCQQADPLHGGTGWFALGYLSPSDATSTGNNGGQSTPLIPGPANWVTVDGFASNNNNIENGQWWYWGNENLYGKNGIGGDQDATGSAIETAVQNSLLSQNLGVTPTGNDAAIPYSLMFVHKSSDTAFPSF